MEEHRKLQKNSKYKFTFGVFCYMKRNALELHYHRAPKK